MNTKPTDIDAYLWTVPDDARATLEELRRTIKAVAPDAVEAISYGMPAFKYEGRAAGLLRGCQGSLRCTVWAWAAHHDELAAYDTSKGTIRFPKDEPLPAALVKTLVSARIAGIEAAAGGRRRKKSGAGRSA